MKQQKRDPQEKVCKSHSGLSERLDKRKEPRGLSSSLSSDKIAAMNAELAANQDEDKIPVKKTPVSESLGNLPLKPKGVIRTPSTEKLYKSSPEYPSPKEPAAIKKFASEKSDSSGKLKREAGSTLERLSVLYPEAPAPTSLQFEPRQTLAELITPNCTKRGLVFDTLSIFDENKNVCYHMKRHHFSDA